MKERPILFSGPMVRAILEGRKTQTRRVIKPQPSGEIDNLGDGESIIDLVSDRVIRCPYGKPGDRLWVRETWVELLHTSPGSDQPEICEGDKLIEPATSYVGADGRTRWTYSGRVIAYRATSKVEFCDGDGFVGEMADKDDMPKWRPSIHMPRWASRITLEIVSVRVEMVNEITHEDCMAEGIQYEADEISYHHGGDDALPWMEATGAFRQLWDSINSSRGYGWDANPWVWVIQFKRV